MTPLGPCSSPARFTRRCRRPLKGPWFIGGTWMTAWCWRPRRWPTPLWLTSCVRFQASASKSTCVRQRCGGWADRPRGPRCPLRPNHPYKWEPPFLGSRCRPQRATGPGGWSWRRPSVRSGPWRCASPHCLTCRPRTRCCGTAPVRRRSSFCCGPCLGSRPGRSPPMPRPCSARPSRPS